TSVGKRVNGFHGSPGRRAERVATRRHRPDEPDLDYASVGSERPNRPRRAAAIPREWLRFCWSSSCALPFPSKCIRSAPRGSVSLVHRVQEKTSMADSRSVAAGSGGLGRWRTVDVVVAAALAVPLGIIWWAYATVWFSASVAVPVVGAFLDGFYVITGVLV